MMKNRKRDKWGILNLWCDCGCKFFVVVGDTDKIEVTCPGCGTKSTLEKTKGKKNG